MADLSRLLDPRSTALLVVDMQNDFCVSGTGGPKVRDPLLRLIAAAREAGALRVFIRAIYDQKYLGQPYADVLHGLGRLGLVCQEGTPGTDYWPAFEAQPGPREIEIEKHRYSAFRQTGLAETLRANGVETVIVTGLTLSTCVGSTVRDAFFDDFFVVLPSDTTADPDPVREATEFAFLGRMFATVTTVDDILAVWTKLPVGGAR